MVRIVRLTLRARYKLLIFRLLRLRRRQRSETDLAGTGVTTLFPALSFRETVLKLPLNRCSRLAMLTLGASFLLGAGHGRATGNLGANAAAHPGHRSRASGLFHPSVGFASLRLPRRPVPGCLSPNGRKQI